MLLDMPSNCTLTIFDGTSNNITCLPLYKINLKRYVTSVDDSTIFFQSNLSYLALKKIIEYLTKLAKTTASDFTVSPVISQYIQAREMYLDTRSKLGIEIKKQDPKLSDKFEIFSETVDHELERKLRPKQMWDAFFMTSMKKSCNFSVPGSGKTSSVYAMFAFLRATSLVKRIIVICPKNAFAPWIDEFSACFGKKDQLKLFSIHNPELSSTSSKKAAIKYDSGISNLFLFNYESVKNYQNEIIELLDDKSILVFDEIHKIKRIDGEYAKASLAIAQYATYVVAMTGTPIPNSYQDIYNLLHILYFEEYDDFFGFSPNHLKNANASTMKTINAKLQPFFCRTTKQQLAVPPANSDSIIPVKASESETKLFRTLLKKHRKNKLLLMLRLLQLESNPQMLLSSINLSDYQYILDDDCAIDEIDYADYSQDIVDCINQCGISSKTNQLINLVNGLHIQGKQIVVWCIFVKTIDNLSNLLAAQGIKVKCVYGEIPLEERQNILAAFKKQEFDVLITNPNTLAESISLHTVCHDAIYFEYSFNLVHLLQSKDRIHRLGLPSTQYTQFYFLQTMYKNDSSYYSMDEEIYHRLSLKEQIMLQAIDADLLETLPSSDDELDIIFNQLGL